MKKYTEIPRLGHQTTLNYLTQVASKGYNVRVGIKLDGANGSFERDENDKLRVYSRREELSLENNLRGFYQYVSSKVDPLKLPKNRKIFGEWLVSHTVQYPKEMYNKFYMFSVFDSEKEVYIDPQSQEYKDIETYLMSVDIEREYVVYEGLYKGMDHIQEIFNKVVRNGEVSTGKQPTTFDEVFNEGIVIKAHDYRDQHGNQLFVKMVSEKFAEVNKPKEKKISGPDTSVEKQIADFAATKARVEKTMNKLIDQAILNEELDFESMPIVAKHVPKLVYEDIMKEELDTIKEQFGEFDEKLIGKKINANVMNFAKDIIRERVESRVKNMQ